MSRKKKKKQGLSEEQRRLRHERKEAKRVQRKQQLAKQEAAKKAATPAKPTFKSPEELMAGLMGDVIHLISAEAQLKKFLDIRLQMAHELKEKNPLKFNELRCDKFEELREEVNAIHELVSQLSTWVGSVNDLTSYKDKMVSIHDHMDMFLDAQVKFDTISKKMETVDAQFNMEIRRPGVTPDTEDIASTEASTPVDTEVVDTPPCEPTTTDLRPDGEDVPNEQHVDTTPLQPMDPPSN